MCQGMAREANTQNTQHNLYPNRYKSTVKTEKQTHGIKPPRPPLNTLPCACCTPITEGIRQPIRHPGICSGIALMAVQSMPQESVYGRFRSCSGRREQPREEQQRGYGGDVQIPAPALTQAPFRTNGTDGPLKLPSPHRHAERPGASQASTVPRTSRTGLRRPEIDQAPGTKCFCAVPRAIKREM